MALGDSVLPRWPHDPRRVRVGLRRFLTRGRVGCHETYGYMGLWLTTLAGIRDIRDNAWHFAGMPDNRCERVCLSRNSLEEMPATKPASGPGSDINSNDFLTQVIYPDNSTDTYTVNALGENKTKTDRNGTTHTYSYDVLGRQTADAVTTLVTATTDGTIQRLETAYDSAGRPYLFTSYSQPGGGTANIVNQVQDIFNGLGQLTTEYQAHSGAVIIGGPNQSPTVQYTYNALTNNNSRLTGIIYPNSRTVSYVYGAGLDDRISRLTSLNDGSTPIESYKYLGLGTVVQRSHQIQQQPTVLS